MLIFHCSTPFPAKPSLLPRFVKLLLWPPVARQKVVSHSMNHSVSDDYPELLASLKPLVRACTMSELNQCSAAGVYAQAFSRMSLLNEIRSHLLAVLREYTGAHDAFARDSYLDSQLYSRVKSAYVSMTARSILDAAPTSAFAPVISRFSELLETLDVEFDFVASVFSRLDIYNTIDHRPSDCGFDVVKEWRKYVTERPARDVRDYYFFVKFPGRRDAASDLLVACTKAVRRSTILQRIFYEMELRHSEGWYVVFDTLTLADDRVGAFYADKNALRDYFRDVGRRVLSAEGRPVKESSSDCYRYFCAPEYGGKHGRLHFHVVHLLRTLPAGISDPNIGIAKRNRVEIPLFKGLWGYGNTMPIAVRYHNDAFTRRGWLMPLDKSGKVREVKPLLAVARYVGKYVNKSDALTSITNGSKWGSHVCQQLNLIPKGLFRVRMSRGFGTRLPSMDNLTMEDLVCCQTLDRSVTRFPTLLRLSARKELRRRLSGIPLFALLDAKPETLNLLNVLRASMQNGQISNPLSSIHSIRPRLLSTDISDGLATYIKGNGFAPLEASAVSTWCAGAK